MFSSCLLLKCIVSVIKTLKPGIISDKILPETPNWIGHISHTDLKTPNPMDSVNSHHSNEAAHLKSPSHCNADHSFFGREYGQEGQESSLGGPE